MQAAAELSPGKAEPAPEMEGPEHLVALIEAAAPEYEVELLSAPSSGTADDLVEVQLLLNDVGVTALRQPYDERPPDDALAADNPYEVTVLADGSEVIVIEGPHFNQAILFAADGIMTNLISSALPIGATTALPAAWLRDIVLDVAELERNS